MQIINALATLFLLEQRASTAADINPYDVSEECMTCVGKKCAALLSGMSELPKNWGSGTEADMASMKSDQALAKVVDCTCQNCGDFDEIKDWSARGDGTGCAVAKAEADGADPDPATEPSGDKNFKDPTGDNTATDSTAAELDPPMELSSNKNFEFACIETKCAALLSGMSEFPENWGSGTEADMASMKSNQAIAKLVDCTCQNCGDSDEVKAWLARGDGTGCAVAKAEADGADPDPATEPSGNKNFEDPTGDNTATDSIAADLDPPMELSGDKNFEDPDSAGLRQGLAAVAPLCAAALAYACL